METSWPAARQTLGGIEHAGADAEDGVEQSDGRHVHLPDVGDCELYSNILVPD